MNRFFFILLFSFLSLSSMGYAKVRILTFHYNHPEFIDMQYKTFKKFMQDDFEIIVFNDANDLKFAKEIKKKCKKYGIRCIRYPQEWHLEQPLNDQIAEWLRDPKITNIHNFISTHPTDIGKQPSVRHCHVIKYALENYGYNHQDVVCIVDGDAFPVKAFSARSLLKDHDIAALLNLKELYLWVVFIAFDPRQIPNKKDFRFDIDVIANTIEDTGSHIYHYLKKNPSLKVRTDIGVSSDVLSNKDDLTLIEEGYSHSQIQLIRKKVWPPIFFHWDKSFFHFFGHSFNIHDTFKEESVKEFVRNILENDE